MTNLTYRSPKTEVRESPIHGRGSNSRLRGKARKIGVGAQEFLRFAKL